MKLVPTIVVTKRFSFGRRDIVARAKKLASVACKQEKNISSFDTEKFFRVFFVFQIFANFFISIRERESFGDVALYWLRHSHRQGNTHVVNLLTYLCIISIAEITIIGFSYDYVDMA